MPDFPYNHTFDSFAGEETIKDDMDAEQDHEQKPVVSFFFVYRKYVCYLFL